jgi:phage host-nuclease inhibitor protein Gam
MDIKPVYDYELVDAIRALEQRYAAQLEQAKQSVQLLTQSVNALRNRRLELEMVEMSDA